MWAAEKERSTQAERRKPEGTTSSRQKGKTTAQAKGQGVDDMIAFSPEQASVWVCTFEVSSQKRARRREEGVTNQLIVLGSSLR